MQHLDVNGVSGKGKIRSEKWWKELAMVMKNYKLIEVAEKQFESRLISLYYCRKRALNST
jgi:hypothetical protein